MSVLTDPSRRQRYDAYRRATRHGMPTAAEGMWDVAKDALVDPLAIASLDVLRQTTELNIGNPFKVQPKPRKWVARPSAPAAPSKKASQSTTGQCDSGASLRSVNRDHRAGGSLRAGGDDGTSASCCTSGPSARRASTCGRACCRGASPDAPLNDVVAIAERFGLDGRFLHAVRELRKRNTRRSGR